MPTARASRFRNPPAPVMIEVNVRLKAIALPEPGGGYSVVVPALPGCVTEAATLEDARQRLIEAAEGWLASTHAARSAEAISIAKAEE